MVTMSAIGIANALNFHSHLLLLLRVDAAAMGELHTSLTLLHQLSVDHVVSVIYSVQYTATQCSEYTVNQGILLLKNFRSRIKLRKLISQNIFCSAKTANTQDSFRGKCPMVVPFSQPQHIDQKRFQALFRTPTPLQLPPHILYMRGTTPQMQQFLKTLPWQLLSSYSLPDFTHALACSYTPFSSRMPVLHESQLRHVQTLCYKISVLKYFCRTLTL